MVARLGGDDMLATLGEKMWAGLSCLGDENVRGREGGYPCGLNTTVGGNDSTTLTDIPNSGNVAIFRSLVGIVEWLDFSVDRSRLFST